MDRLYKIIHCYGYSQEKYAIECRKIETSIALFELLLTIIRLTYNPFLTVKESKKLLKHCCKAIYQNTLMNQRLERLSKDLIKLKELSCDFTRESLKFDLITEESRKSGLKFFKVDYDDIHNVEYLRMRLSSTISDLETSTYRHVKKESLKRLKKMRREVRKKWREAEKHGQIEWEKRARDAGKNTEKWREAEKHREIEWGKRVRDEEKKAEKRRANNTSKEQLN
ncbi:MAG: hypothetical protein OXE77_11910 [Flavobacteriaceae bacterium]|nr:hypothetical protein [Flavobacteriaceae bacterium]MCY4266766.1 hypothetical protein [Flavobacteriaceae bacterium]MCY4298048.1 hypothetical protein [Flavobacteriaceae bacterium]